MKTLKTLPRVQVSDVIWHFSEPVSTNLALFKMVWYQKYLKFIYCFAPKKKLLAVWLQIFLDLVNKLRNLALFIWKFGTEALPEPNITGSSWKIIFFNRNFNVE